MRRALPALIFGCFLILFFAGLNFAYPILGHDYFYFIPRLLVGKWHVMAQGFAPLRWAPQLCGGFPVYGNPHDFFYSLPQLLSLFLDPWTAIQIGIAAALVLGCVGWHRFGKDVLGLDSTWAHVLTLVILSNGYYFMHMIAGHVDYFTLPLLGWLLWFAFERGRVTLRKSILFALLFSSILYAAGYFILPLGILLAGSFLPFELLGHHGRVGQRLLGILKRATIYAPLTIALSASKLVAVWSLMSVLPRTIPFDVFPPNTSGFLFVLKSFFAIPQSTFLFEGVNKWGIHEYSMFLSPIVLIGTAVGARNFFRKRTDKNQIHATLQLGYALLLLTFFVALTRGYGISVDWLKSVPIFSSLRVTVRFLYVPATLLCMFGIQSLSRLFNNDRHQTFILPVAGSITLIAVIVAYWPLLSSRTLLLTMRYDGVLQAMQESNYLRQSVATVKLLPEAMPSDIEAVLSSSTSIGCYEPLLDGSTMRAPLREGRADLVTGTTFNLQNPACFQYPDANGCTPGDKIAVDDKENFVKFTNGLKTSWKLSTMQRIADGVSLLALIFSMLFLFVTFIQMSKRFMMKSTSSNDAGMKPAPDGDILSSKGAGFIPAVVAVKNLAGTIRTMSMHPRFSRALGHTKKFLLQKSSGSPENFRRFLTVVFSVVGLAFIAYICAFKLLDRDFWWHITAGKMMVQTGSLIASEPFSYARLGMPYLANHEWLAQIILYLLYVSGGSTAVILFRTGVMLASLGIILQIDRKNFWFLVPVAILAANSIRGAFIERPQLFTFLIFSCLLFLTFRMLGLTDRRPLSKTQRRNFLIGFAVLQILWVNLHGGASLLALLFPGILFLETLASWFRASPREKTALERDLQWFVLLGIVLGIGLFCSPITYENITYLWKLMNDRTIIYIQEWQPDKLDLYLKNVGPFWIFALGAIAVGRKNIVSNVLLTLITGYLSAKALRHGPLFVLSSLAVGVHQLKNNADIERLRGWLLARRIVTILVSALVLLGLTQYVHAQYSAFVRPDQLQGYGTFEFGKGAADFLDRNNVQGTMFNTYGIGGYLIHRNKKVFIDGRNVDYGFAYMNETYLAGIDPVQWQKLEKKYGFTYAVIDYFSNKDKKKDILMYTQFLESNPDWSLVYVDDWTAVFLKNVSENKAIIDKFAFKLLTTSGIEFNRVLDAVSQDQYAAFETELRRAIADSPNSIKARIILGKLLIRQGRLDDAQVVTQDAAIAAPRSPEPHALFAAIYIVQKNWGQAASELDKAIRLAGKDYPNLDYALVAQVFLQAGRVKEAKVFARKAGLTISERQEEVAPTNPDGTSAITNPVPKQGTGSEAPMVNPAQDSIDFHDKALAFAEAGRNAEARENFLISLKLNPSFAQAWNNLGTLSFLENKLDEAKTEYERAIQEDPTYADPHYNLALLLAKQGNLKAARIQADLAKKYGKDISALEPVLK